jgi:hypothetical protein
MKNYGMIHFCLSSLSPSWSQYPQAYKPYGLEAEPEAVRAYALEGRNTKKIHKIQRASRHALT